MNILEILLKASGGDQAKAQIGLVSGAASTADQIFRKLGDLLSVGALMKGIQASIKEFENQERATIKLTSALRGQNITSEAVAKGFLNQANELMSLTEFTDDAITSAQAYALSMGVSADTVKKMTPAVLDFAAATGTELTSAFALVGRAALGMTDQLRRHGIMIDENELKTKGFSAVLEKLEKNYGGTAKSIKDGVLGPSIEFKQTMGELGEIIGQTVLPGINLTSKAVLLLGKNLTGTNMRTQEQAAQEKELTRIGREVINNDKERAEWIKVVKEQDGRAMDAYIKNHNKKKEIQKTEIKDSKEMTAKLKEMRDKEQKEEDEKIEKSKDKIEKEYDLRRELRQMDLDDVIANIEKEIALQEEGSEKRMALEKALVDYKSALGIENAAKVAEIQDSISSNLESNITDMLLAEKSLGEGIDGIWDGIKKTIVEAIVKTVIEEKAAALIRIAAEQAVAAAKSIAAYSGIPFVGIILGLAAAAVVASEINKRSTFQGGGTVPGAEGVPVQATVHGGERVITPQQQRRGVGGGVNIGTIQILFPNVTTFSDWMNASPALVKQVTENKILQAFATLEDEGKVKQGTVLI